MSSSTADHQIWVERAWRGGALRPFPDLAALSAAETDRRMRRDHISGGARRRSEPGRDALRAKAARLLAGAAGAALLGALAAPVLAREGGGADLAGFDPIVIGMVGAIGAAVAAMAWAVRVSASSRSQSFAWTQRLAEMEGRLEKAEAVLSAHPGLVLVWEDDNDAIEKGWGKPKILGGPAALASLMSFGKPGGEDAGPVDSLLDALGELPVEDDGPPEDIKKLRDKVRDLRAHGIAFSGSVVTHEGREIEADGRVAGGQVALWLTDPAVRMAEDSGGIVGKVRERTTDLHGALAMLERAPMPAWRRDSAFALVWVNRAYVEAVEATTASEVIKGQIELDPGARKIAEKAAAERRAAEARLIVNIRGERRVLRVLESPLHSAGDAALGGLAFDITELDRARSELKLSNEANRRTLDQIPAAVALFNPAQNLLYNNRAFLDLWDLDEAELAGGPTHGDILDRLRHARKLPEQADYAAWKGEQLALYTAELPGAGSPREGEAPDDVWHLPDGRTLRVARARHPLGGVLVVFDDITERLELEARYNTQISVQRATLNNLSEGVAVFAADGTLRLHNAAFQKLWRLDAEMLGARPHIDRVLGAIAPQARSETAFADVKRRVTSFSPEDRAAVSDRLVALHDGRTLSFGSEPLPDGATLIYFLDVTDSREREKELKERNAFLQDIDRQKSKFVDHVSYQLRTPLMTIIGFAEMIDNEMFGVLNDRQKDYIASILEAGYHLRDLINDIFDLAVIDAGKMTLETGEVDVRDLLENAATYAALKAEDTQVALKVDCPKDIGAIVADAKRLKQVLFNLLSNAFNYTGAGGEVTIGADRAPGLVRIWVADTGRGVSAEDQAKAFDPFESRGPSAGAGLGLSLVRSFVELHDGWVRMESDTGKGTRVTLHLPAQAGAATPSSTQGEAGPRLAASPKPAASAPSAPKRAPLRRSNAGAAE